MKYRNVTIGIAASLGFGLFLLIPSCAGHSTCQDRGYCPDEPWGFGGGTSGSGGVANGGDSGSSAGDSSTSGGSGGSGGGAAAGHAGNAGDGDGTSGSSGAGGALPCDGQCKGATPVCDLATNECVQCLNTSDCKAPVPACDATTNTCVECAKNADCKDAAKPFCDATAQQCVACLKQADCSSPTTSACNAGVCTACTKDDECSAITGRGVCDAGTCVQCTVVKESACTGNSCNPATKQCTQTPAGSRDLCEACVADSECMGGNKADPDTRCVVMKFMGVPRAGGFCLRRKSKGCSRPYSVVNSGASLSGNATEDYCGIGQDTTTCEAMLDLTTNGALCLDSNDSSCGCTRDKDGKCTSPGQGGLCRNMVGTQDNRCTYACGVPEQCPSGLACGGVGYCH